MINKILSNRFIRYIVSAIVSLAFLLGMGGVAFAQYPPQTETGGVGLEGKISSPPPTQAPTITSPSNGAVFANLPITVTGYCPNNLLIKLFKNNVFSGSVMCNNSSYSLQSDLFSASNQLVAIAYDALDQAGPESNKVTVTYHDSVSHPNIVDRVLLTTNYARRGANPNELLTWPIIISGGNAPYAVSVDWGDGSSSDVYSVTTPGEFTIKHQFEQSGVYRALVKATDRNGTVAYLQLVAIGNGQANQQSVAGATADKNQTAGKTIVMWQPAAIAIPLIISTFWIGKRYEILKVKRRLQKGEHPFGS